MSINLPVVDTHQIGAAVKGNWHAHTLVSHHGVNFKYRVMRDTCAEFHVHQTPEAFFVLSGTVTIDTEHASVTLKSGQFFEVPPHTAHRSRVDGETTLLVIDQNAA